MEKNYLDLTLNDFLDVITNMELKHKVEFKNTIPPFDSKIHIGTKRQLLDVMKGYIERGQYTDCIKDALRKLDNADEYKYNFNLDEIEIYTYLEKITGNFDLEKVKITLRNIDCYYNMIYLEVVNEESYLMYLQNKWEIPTVEMNDFVTKDIVHFPDYVKMRAKTHIARDYSICQAIGILKSKINISRNNPFSHKWEIKHLQHIAGGLLELGKIDNVDIFLSVMSGKQGCINWHRNKTDLKVFLSYFCRHIKYNPQGTPEIIPNSKFPLKEANLLFNINGEKLTKGSFEIPFQNEYDKMFAIFF